MLYSQQNDFNITEVSCIDTIINDLKLNIKGVIICDSVFFNILVDTINFYSSMYSGWIWILNFYGKVVLNDSVCYLFDMFPDHISGILSMECATYIFLQDFETMFYSQNIQNKNNMYKIEDCKLYSDSASIMQNCPNPIIIVCKQDTTPEKFKVKNVGLILKTREKIVYNWCDNTNFPPDMVHRIRIEFCTKYR